MPQSDIYNIKLKEFEGPFDLLLFFIERDELDIYNISISNIVEDFLDYIHQMSELNIALSSEFIFIASKLMKIKSKSLLPSIHLDEEEDEYSEENLIKRLAEYKKIKNISLVLSSMEDERLTKSARGNALEEYDDYIQSIKNNVEYFDLPDAFQLYKTYKKILTARHVEQDEKIEVALPVYSIEEQKKYISDLIDLNKKINCLDIMEQSEDRPQFIVNFLAVLELLQQKIIQIQLLPGFNNFYLRKKKPLKQ